MPPDESTPQTPPPPPTRRAPIPKPERFQWPPGQSPTTRLGDDDSDHSASATQVASMDSQPEKSPRTQRPSTNPNTHKVRRHAADSAGTPAPAHWWNIIEETWLGVVRPSWAQRRVESQWRPESHGLWCPQCGHSVGDFEVAPDDDAQPGCSRCGDVRVPWKEIVRLGTYEGLLRDAILEVKFGAWRRLASDVGRELGAQLAQTLASHGIPLEDVVLVPVPVALRRRLLRGIDHTLCLTRGVRAGLLDAWESAGAAPSASAVAIVRPLKRQYRPTQTRRDAEHRRRNVANSMAARDGALHAVKGKTIVLIDDVLTTGATVREACRALGVSGKKQQDDTNIIVAVVAVTDDA